MAQTQLDPGQVIKHSYDEVNEAIKVNLVAGAGAGGASQADESPFVEGSTGVNPIGGVYDDSIGSPASGEAGAARITPARALHTNLRDNNGTEVGTSSDPLRVDPTGTTPQPASQSGTWNINNVSGAVSLPSGASTSAKQDTGNTSLASLDSKTVAVNTGAVVVASSALPSGASTSALQSTGNTSIASIDSKTPALGQALSAASTPVVLPAAQITALTPPTTLTVTQATGTNLHAVIDSSALPTGAATEGSLGFIVTTSQQAANNTASLNLAAGTNTAGATGPMILASVTTNAPTYGSTQLHPPSMTTAGRLRVDAAGTVAPLPTGAATEATIAARLSGSLVPTAFDYVGLTYVTTGNGIGQIATALYKTGGASGTLVKTLTLSYDVNNKLSSVTAS